MAINVALTEILACPICKGKLKYDRTANRLICTFDKLAYRISQNIPVLLATDATPITQEEYEQWHS